MTPIRLQLWATSLICCLTGLLPTGATAMPDINRTTATVTARVLAPVSLAISYDSTQKARPVHLIISLPDEQVFQLHIDSDRHHSYEQGRPGHQYPLHVSSKLPKSRQMAQKQTHITLFFN